MSDNNVLRLKILIVDDKIGDAQRMKRRLKYLEHDIIICTKQEDAVRLISDEDNIYDPVDVAIIDYWMPGELGDKLGLRLQDIDPYLSVIIYTSDASASTHKKVMLSDLKPYGFYKKIDNIDKILSTLNYALSNKKAILSNTESFIESRIQQFQAKGKNN